MLLYLGSFIICYVIGISKQSRNANIRRVVFFIIALFLCSGFMCGSDWRSYELIYNSVGTTKYGVGYFAEPGFYVYISLFHFLGIDFWNFTLFTKLLCFAIIYKTMCKYMDGNIFLAMMYFIPWYAFYLFIDCPMRNMLAMSIFLLAIPYLKSRKFIKYLLLIILASLFHFSAFIYIVLYFFALKRISTTFFIILYVIVNLLFASRQITINLISLIFGNIPYVAWKLESYIQGENVYASGRILSFGMILHLIYFIMILYSRRRLEKFRDGNLIINTAILYLLLYRVAGTIEIFMRFLLFLSPFFCIALVRCADVFKINSRNLYYVLLLLIAMIGSQRIFADYRYIPYTSYLPYMIKGEYPSYEYRSMYNFIHSPYSE